MVQYIALQWFTLTLLFLLHQSVNSTKLKDDKYNLWPQTSVVQSFLGWRRFIIWITNSTTVTDPFITHRHCSFSSWFFCHNKLSEILNGYLGLHCALKIINAQETSFFVLQDNGILWIFCFLEELAVHLVYRIVISYNADRCISENDKS